MEEQLGELQVIKRGKEAGDSWWREERQQCKEHGGRRTDLVRHKAR